MRRQELILVEDVAKDALHARARWHRQKAAGGAAMLGDTDVLGQLGLVGEEPLEAPLEMGQPPEAVIVQRLGGLEEAGCAAPG